MKKDVINVKLDDGEIVRMEAYCSDEMEECGPAERLFEASNDYLKTAKNVIKNLKNLDIKPDEIELEFGIKLEVGTGNLVSWIAADSNAEASMGVKLKWGKATEK